VGYDPITKREIPRSYVYFLETRLGYFESLLQKNNISYESADVFDADSRLLGDQALSPVNSQSWKDGHSPLGVTPKANRNGDWERKQEDKDKIDKLVSNIGMVSVQGASDPRYLGSTSGISFARVVLAAVKSSVSTNNSERAGSRPSKNPASIASAGGSSMRDSYFGLQTKPSLKEASFPDRQLGDKLLHLYFEYANPQIPILHRGEFMDLVDRAYSVDPSRRTSRELYLLNIVFAIGAGIIWGSSDPAPDSLHAGEYAVKRPRLTNQQAQPEEYHASAIVHLGAFLSSSATDGADRSGGDLEELQAVLLLAAFALLRPVAPGLWYIVGVAMRLAVDLGLHYEDGTGIEGSGGPSASSGKLNHGISPTRSVDAREKGRREWMRDLRRRLWWCTYNFDRLVSTCVGRPFGITDQVVTTEFPSLLDDRYITRTGFVQAPAHMPSYKLVSHHYFRLRLLQSEILQVLQYQQAQLARLDGTNRDNQFIHTDLYSPFLAKFDSFRSWRANIDQRLYEWKEAAPQQEETGVSFDRKFLELNYWQAVTTLYRQSLSVPAPLAGELSPTEEVSSPSSTLVEEKDDEDLVFLKCAEAGQKTLKLYRQIHRQRLVNYTYLATHHLFMAGVSFLYAVWHSPTVRSRLVGILRGRFLWC
jgi:Fungal specific transcription factor domain